MTTARGRVLGAGLFETWGNCIVESTIIKFGLNDGGGNDKGGFEIEIRVDATQLTNMLTAEFGGRRDLFYKGEMFIKYKAELVSRVDGVERILASCFFSLMSRN